MLPIYYKSSEGVVIDLISPQYRMLTDTDIFNWEWQYETVGTNYPYVSAFKNQMISRSFTVRVSGTSEEDKLANLEHFVAVVDRDVRLDKAGRIYVGDYYRECLIIGTNKDKVFKTPRTKLECTLLAEEGDWKSNQLQSYSGVSGGKWLNKYAVPSVSSNEQNYQYGMIEDANETFTFTADFEQVYDVSYYTGFTFESVSANVQYRFTPVGTYTTVTPSDCPLDIDVSSKEEIYIKPSGFCTISYSMTAEPNASYINWSSAADDEVREFVLDLGDVSSVESVTGLEVENFDSITHNAYIKLSQDNINWATVETVEVQAFNKVDLEFTPSSPVDFRYIKITSDGVFKVSSRTFKIEAYFTGEEQNLATSVVVSSSPNQTYEINDGIVSLYRYFSGVGNDDILTLTLPSTTTIVAINNLTLTNLRSGYNQFIIEDANGNIIDRVTLSANETISYSWSGEVETSQIRLLFVSKYGEITSDNFELLEEQQVAPHRYILNENYVPSDAIIKIYGATTSPSITIGGNQYGAENITLDADEWLEINTKDETIVITDGEGIENVFYHRLENSFEKIEVGSSEITWNGNLTVDIELLNSRSDPKWS